MSEANTIDTVFDVHTPEYTEFRYYRAGVFERMFACAIDHLIIFFGSLIMLFAFGLLGVLGGDLMGLLLSGSILILVAIAWLYFAVFEALWGGRTPGKALFKLRVVSGEGTPMHPTQALIRNLLRVVDMMPSVSLVGSLSLMPFYALGFLSVFFSRHNQRLGDLAANTVVIKDRTARERTVKVPPVVESAQLNALPKGLVLSREQGRALTSFIQRREDFSELRRDEMAMPLAQQLRKRYGLDESLSFDMILCLVYVRVFGASS